MIEITSILQFFVFLALVYCSSQDIRNHTVSRKKQSLIFIFSAPIIIYNASNLTLLHLVYALIIIASHMRGMGRADLHVLLILILTMPAASMVIFMLLVFGFGLVHYAIIRKKDVPLFPSIALAYLFMLF